MSIIQYIKDTRGELRHVAWPTRLQTIVYTILVALLSVVVALYLGLFDYIFTSGLKNFLEILPEGSTVTQEVVQNPTNSPQATPPIQLESIDTSDPIVPEGAIQF